MELNYLYSKIDVVDFQNPKSCNATMYEMGMDRPVN